MHAATDLCGGPPRPYNRADMGSAASKNEGMATDHKRARVFAP